MNRAVFVLMTAAVLMLAAASASAQFVDSKPTRTGFRIGLLTGGTVTFAGSGSDNEYDADADESVTGGFVIERMLSERAIFEFALDIYNIKGEGELFGHEYDESALMLHGSFGLKMQFLNKTGRLAIRPGVAFGLGLLESVAEVESTHQYTIRVFAEAVLFNSRGSGFSLELGAIVSPSGGNDEVDTHTSAFPIIRLGLLL